MCQFEKQIKGAENKANGSYRNIKAEIIAKIVKD